MAYYLIMRSGFFSFTWR